jgi:hypothetical protein
MAYNGIKFITVLVLLCMVLPLRSQQLREGDLLFCSPDEPNAITAVTNGVGSLPIDHVAVVHRIGGDNGPLFVIEAVKPAVCLTPIDTFLVHNPVVLQGRVVADVDVSRSVKRCLRLVGKPYDDLFLPGDSAVYCSELVQLCYVDSSGTPVFEPVPMSFHDQSGRITDHWREFYALRGMAVPEGAPGTNPGELSRRPQVTILGRFPRDVSLP